MKRRIAAIIFMGALAAVPAITAAADRPVLSSVKDLMASIVDPSADAIWNAVGTVVDQEHGVQDLAPKTDEDWAAMRQAAIRIIEGGNLLMMPGRDAAPPGTKSDTPGVELEPAEIAALIRKNRRAFDGFARELQSLAAEALRATDRKDVPALLDIGARMDEVCESCHQTFWYPPQPSRR